MVPAGRGKKQLFATHPPLPFQKSGQIGHLSTVEDAQCLCKKQCLQSQHLYPSMQLETWHPLHTEMCAQDHKVLPTDMRWSILLLRAERGCDAVCRCPSGSRALTWIGAQLSEGRKWGHTYYHHVTPGPPALPMGMVMHSRAKKQRPAWRERCLGSQKAAGLEELPMVPKGEEPVCCASFWSIPHPSCCLSHVVPGVSQILILEAPAWNSFFLKKKGYKPSSKEAKLLTAEANKTHPS